ncbi:MAG: TRAP transporter large permease subunit, partial [Paracoccaceae bacterium]
EQNIAKLFLAAFIPGILAAIGYVIAISIYVRVFPGSAGTRPPVPWGERFAALFHVWPVLLVFGLVVGGIYLGWFTPTEGAAVGAAGTGLAALLAGSLNWAVLRESLMGTAKTTGMIFFIVLGAGFYNGFLALSGVPQFMADWVVGQGYSPWFVLVVILVFYLIFGCLMDSLSMILLTVPIFFPVVSVLDFGLVDLITLQHEAARAALSAMPPPELAPDTMERLQAALANGQEIARDIQRDLGIRVTKSVERRMELEHTAIWFGILVLIVVEVGLITPPVGLNLFVINSMDRDTPMMDTYKAVVFFVASDLVRVVILVMFPAITLFLL